MIFIQNLKLFLYLFFKNKLSAILFLLFSISIHILQLLNFIFYREGNVGALSQLFTSLILSTFGFVIFVFLSYEYFYTVRKSNVLELLKSTKFAMLKFYGFQFIVLLLLNVFITLSYSIYNVAIYFYYGFNQKEFLIHILLNILLNIFILQLVAILFGWVLALVFKRLTAYMMAIVFILLGSPIFEEIAFNVLFSSGINLYPVFDLFNFSEPSLGWSSNFFFGFSILPERFLFMFIWSAMLFSLVLFKLIRKRTIRNGVALISLIVFASSLYYYQQPTSKYVMNYNPNGSLMYDYFYYEHKETQTEAPLFNVLSYELDITVKNRLNVIATLTVDEQLPEYHFTLYHKYMITHVTNQEGDLMNFVQEGDYFSVYNDEENLEAMVVHYVGYSPRFYSNQQGVILPGFFPYFPHAGYHSVFYFPEETFEPIMLPQEAEFNITINGVNNVFSNLEEISPGHFSGRTTSVTLVSGFVNRQLIDGIEVVYPFLNNYEFNDESIHRLSHQFIQEYDESDRIQKIILLPNLNLHHMTTVVHSDHITARGLVDLAWASEHARINPRKQPLYFLIEIYITDHVIFEEVISSELDIDFDNRIATMMAEQIETLGLDLFLELAMDYIENDEDRRSVNEFLIDLYE